MKISVIVPMYNEEENVVETITRIAQNLKENYFDWELIVVDDGSTDQTYQLAKDISLKSKRIRIVTYQPNRGRGKALREGFAYATGDIIVTCEADLSYDETHIPKLVSALEQNKGTDIVVGSPFIKGGFMKGVKPYRLFLSKFGNKILGFALPGSLHTVTGMLRAYRRPVLQSLDLESNGKEIHLEILSKALSLGYRVEEIPAISLARQKGHSKFKFRETTSSHLLFSFFEKPMLLFGSFGALLLFSGLLSGSYIIYLWKTDVLSPFRPLMILTVLLIVVGVIILFFGFIATQISALRREMYRIQAENLEVVKRLEEQKK